MKTKNFLILSYNLCKKISPKNLQAKNHLIENKLNPWNILYKTKKSLQKMKLWSNLNKFTNKMKMKNLIRINLWNNILPNTVKYMTNKINQLISNRIFLISSKKKMTKLLYISWILKKYKGTIKIYLIPMTSNMQLKNQKKFSIMILNWIFLFPKIKDKFSQLNYANNI